MKIINKTPHPVHFYRSNETISTFQPDEHPIRLKEYSEHRGEINGIPVHDIVYESDDVPEYDENIIYIVSRMVKDRFPDRTDFMVPYDLVRNESGTIIGCKALAL